MKHYQVKEFFRIIQDVTKNVKYHSTGKNFPNFRIVLKLHIKYKGKICMLIRSSSSHWHRTPKICLLSSSSSNRAPRLHSLQTNVTTYRPLNEQITTGNEHYYVKIEQTQLSGDEVDIYPKKCRYTYNCLLASPTP